MLGTEERSLIERLRKEDENWRWARWIPLVWSAFAIGFPLYYYFHILHQLRTALPSVHEVPITRVDLFETGSYATLASLLFVLFFAGLFVAGWVVGHWRGSRFRKLLLVLAREVLHDGQPSGAT